MNFSQFQLLRELAEGRRSPDSLDFEEKSILSEFDLSSANIEKILTPFKVSNAIVMAAGFSSRFAPLSYETPKGLTVINGEALIERQIKQLQSAGVKNIIVVVGYKSELFTYLEEKFSVEVILNSDYNTRNNHSTLMLVRDLLANSYICSSDNYFPNNPFHSYEYSAYYAALWSEGETDEWCMQRDADGFISKVTIGGAHSWFMNGHAYFDREYSEEFRKILEQEYDKPETRDKHWEKLFAEHINYFRMKIKEFHTNDILEFDSINEALAYDPAFLTETSSEMLDFISRGLGCSKMDLKNFRPYEPTKRINLFDVNNQIGFFYCAETEQHQEPLNLPPNAKVLARNMQKKWLAGFMG